MYLFPFGRLCVTYLHTHARVRVRSGRMQQMKLPLKLEHEAAERNFTSQKQLRERHTNTANGEKEIPYTRHASEDRGRSYSSLVFVQQFSLIQMEF